MLSQEQLVAAFEMPIECSTIAVWSFLGVAR